MNKKSRSNNLSNKLFVCFPGLLFIEMNLKFYLNLVTAQWPNEMTRSSLLSSTRRKFNLFSDNKAFGYTNLVTVSGWILEIFDFFSLKCPKEIVNRFAQTCDYFGHLRKSNLCPWKIQISTKIKLLLAQFWKPIILAHFNKM